ncbi:hypothetical protein CAPTEDRAFT_228861 [Capitella teleta]|uniref:F-actin monooxygenase n=1 Tax=Capitella teleta TaxID=283909 RepID=R7TB09_CAPTE|nr:hypothetical protein CAPTEDRAFT_228861 [Capitella teleta]|eukprot:ELT88179.1 hypothetical protein CAPTEDRAFT_228861 [Capitella teleta]
MMEPNPQTGRGWHVVVEPENHFVNSLDFDVIIGADGKRNSLPGYTRKCFRGKLAIAITLNLVNKRSKEENRVSEIGGLFYVFAQEFFNKLKDQASIDLENIVYYRDETHYFVMTAKKKCLLDKGVLREVTASECEDLSDSAALLSKENLNREMLRSFAVEAADLATDKKLPHLEVEKNHYGEDDVAIFDFTAMHQAEQSCIARERHGKTLLTCIVGDTLIEPFWPTGSGCARGFLSVFDAAWLLRDWCNKSMTYLQAIECRENIYQLLSQTTPSSLSSKLNKYTINPVSRYGSGFTSNTRSLTSNHVQSLYVTKPLDSKPVFKRAETSAKRMQNGASKDSRFKSRNTTLDTSRLLKWFQCHLESFKDVVEVTDLNCSWRNGLALCSLVQLFRPHLIDVRKLNQTEVKANCQLGLSLVQKEFNVTSLLNADEMVKDDPKDRLLVLSYLVFLQEALDNEPLPKLRKMNQRSPKTSLSESSPKAEKSPLGLALSSVCKSLTMDRRKPEDLNTLTRSLTFGSMSLDRRVLPRAEMTKITSAVRRAYVARTLLRLKSKKDSKLSERKSPPVTSPIRKQKSISKKVIKKRLSWELEENPRIAKQLPETTTDPSWWTKSLKACRGIAKNQIETFNMDERPAVKLIPKNVKVSVIDRLPEDDGFMLRSRTLRACKGKAGAVIKKIESIDKEEKEEEKEKEKEEEKESREEESSDEENEEPVNYDDLTYCDTLQRSRKTPPSVAAQRPIRRTAAVRRKLSPIRSDGSPVASVDSRSYAINIPHSGDLEEPLEGSMYPTASLRACKGIAMGRIQAFQQAGTTPTSIPPKGPPPQMTRTPRKLPDLSPAQEKEDVAMVTDECCVCGEHLYLVERHTAHGYSFHRGCYKCSKCGTHLRAASSVVLNDPSGPVKFFCQRHAYEAGLMNVEWSQMSSAASDCDTSSSLDLEEFELTAEEMLQYMVAPGDSDAESDDDDDDDADGAVNTKGGEEGNEEEEEEEDVVLLNEASEQMILCEGIQRELNDVDDEGEELEDRGRCMERSLSKPSATDPKEGELMDEWVDVMQRKRELIQKEAQLMLQVRLLALRQRQMNVQRQLTSLAASEDFEKCIADLDTETDDLEKEMTGLLEQLADLHIYVSQSQT